MGLGGITLGISSLLGGGSTYALKELLKNLKKVGRLACETAGVRMRNRRSYIFAELQTWRKLLKISPGLLAPRFPQILAALSFAKSEILSYFQHVGMSLPGQSQERLAALRKDSKKRLNVSTYYAADITLLMNELYAVLTQARQYSWVVRRYYFEYILGNDLSETDTICARSGGQIAALKPLLNEAMAALKSLQSNVYVKKLLLAEEDESEWMTPSDSSAKVIIEYCPINYIVLCLLLLRTNEQI